ncbi:porin family protein [Chitinophaga alhagiae]|nr:porin family protein [Chitinophaga alhagiae]
MVEDKLPVKPAQKTRKRGFEGGITLSADYNSVPSLKYGRIGFGGGLLIKYHISNSFYLSTGASYTKKLYGAEDRDYTSNYPTNYKKIEADCNVLDVPLNLHYTFLHRPKARWSAMAGASSYFMLKEKYEYYNYSGGKYTREYNNSNHHYFSVLNLGVNYERETRGRISWGLQPFVKVPLSGVGAGGVKLHSAGVSLQVTVGQKK